MIVLDTNVLSEVMRPRLAAQVIAWFARQRAREVFTKAVTEAEIRYGVELLAEGRRRGSIRTALEQIFAEDMGGRVLPFDREAARAFAEIAAARQSCGRPISQLDTQIAAIARSRGASVASRNVSDFADCRGVS